ncbi:MAG: hypothetical protein ACI87A_000154 [Planctomycetota bacterium]|jgi:hypothetical protein
MMASGLLAVVMGGVAMVSTAGQSTFTATTTSSTMDTLANQVTSRLLRELEGLDPSSMVPDPGIDGISDLIFQSPWGSLTRLAYQIEASETNDGIDNDGDGLIDEASIFLTRDVGGANEITTVICNNVSELLAGEVNNEADDNGNDMDDEPGFCLQRLGDLLIVRVTVLDVDAEGALSARTIETSMRMRN